MELVCQNDELVKPIFIMPREDNLQKFQQNKENTSIC
jgi:hypothetical protein